MKLKINGLMEDSKILWKKISCKCHKSDIELKYPLIDCIHCKCQVQEDSMPRSSFKVNQSEFDKDGKPTGKTIVKEVTEITIVRGKTLNEIIGWTY